MGRFSSDSDLESPHSLSGGLEGPVRTKRGLEHEATVRPACESNDESGRFVTADLFVGIDEEHGRDPQRRSARLVKRLDREESLYEARLHVVGARPPKGAAFRSRRHRLEGADRPHRIAVAEDQLVALVACSGARHRQQHAAALNSRESLRSKRSRFERVA